MGITEAVDAATLIERLPTGVEGLGSQLTTTAAAIATNADGALNAATVNSLAQVLAAGLTDVRANNANRADTTVNAALSAVGALADAMDEARTGPTAAADRQAADSVVAVVQAASGTLMGSASVGESRQLASTSVTLACVRDTNDGSTGSLRTAAGANVAFGTRPQPADGTSAADICIATVSSNFYGRVDANSTVLSPIVSVNVMSSESAMKMHITNNRIALRLPLSNDANATTAGNRERSCGFFDTAKGRFDSAGCRTTATSAVDVQCECTHLTDFAVTVNQVDIGNFEDAKLAGIIYVSAICGLCLVLLPIGFCVDQRRQRQHVEAQFAAAERAETQLEEESVHPLTNTTSLGSDALLGRPLLHDAAAERRRLSLLAHWLQSIRTNHPWIAPFAADARSHYTVPQRIAVLFAVLLTQLFCNGWFYVPDPDPWTSVKQTAAATGVSIPLTLAVATLVGFWFRRSQRSEFDARRRRMDELLRDHGEWLEEPSALLESAKPDHPAEALVVVPMSPSDESPVRSDKKAVTTVMVAPLRPESRRDSMVLRRVDSTANEGPLKSFTAASTASQFPTMEEVAAAAASFTRRRRHLIAITLRALDVANRIEAAAFDDENLTLVAALDVLGLERPTQLCAVLDASAFGGSMGGAACALLNAVLEAHLSHVAVDATPRFLPAKDDLAMTQELYGDEMQGVAWRLAIECVHEHEYRLAECLFTMHLLLEHPDLFFLFFTAPAPTSLEDILFAVCNAAQPSDRMCSMVNAGRLWCALYTRRYQHAERYETALERSTAATPAILAMLLGLTADPNPNIVAYGCVPYALAMEAESEVPTLDSCGDSLVMRAHAMRLAKKPVGDRWERSIDERVTEACIHDLKAVCSVRCVLASDKLRSSGGHERDKHSFIAYSAAVTEGDVGAGAWLLRRVDKPSYQLVITKETRHTNFYATIEYGRMLTLFEAQDRGTWPMAACAQAYLAECDELRELTDAGLTQLRREPDATSWKDAKGLKNAQTREIMGNNIFSGSYKWLLDDGMRALITAAIIEGRIALPYGDAVVQSLHVRFAVGAPTDSMPLTHLARFHAPIAAGCGTPTTPHIGVTSAARSARLGERVELFAGVYRPIVLRHIHATLRRPLEICPVGYHAMLAAAPPNTGRRCLTATERNEIHRCIVRKVRSLKKDSQPLVTLESCSHIRLRGLELDGPTAVSAIVRQDTNVRFEHCEVVCRVAVVSDTGDAILEKFSNAIVSTANALHTAVISDTWPAGFAAVGYVFFAGAMIFFALMCVFLTAGFDNDTANEWALRSAVTTVVMAFAMQPVTALGTAAFSFASNVGFAALVNTGGFHSI
jgi:hypothetical protein